MIKTILIEDEAYIRKGLRALIDTLDKGLDIVAECATVSEATTVVKACKPDLVFLDINLPDGDAFDFLGKTQELDYKVIFSTAFDDHALKALKLGAIDYILKPVDIEELEVAIDKAVEATANLQPQQIRIVKEKMGIDRLVVSLQDGYQVINFSELMYCQSDKGYTTFYLDNGKAVLASKPLKFFVEQLPGAKFVRTHQSCLVNLDYVDRYDKNGMVVLKNNQNIPVSMRKKDEFLARLLNR